MHYIVFSTTDQTSMADGSSHLLTFFENSDPTKRFRLQTEQSKFPAQVSVVTGVDIYHPTSNIGFIL